MRPQLSLHEYAYNRISRITTHGTRQMAFDNLPVSIIQSLEFLFSIDLIMLDIVIWVLLLL